MSKRSQRNAGEPSALGLASVSLSMASGACAVIGEANASTPPQQTHEIFLAEEESPTSAWQRSILQQREAIAATIGARWMRWRRRWLRSWRRLPWRRRRLRLPCRLRSCWLRWRLPRRLRWWLRAHGRMRSYGRMSHGRVPRCGGCHGRRFFFGGCVGCAGGCGGCGDGCGDDTCWIWTPSGWIYSCSSNATPTSEG